MKMRVFAAASILLTVVLVAAISHAAPSCCDPKNSSTPGATLAPGQPTRGPILATSPQQRVVTPQVTPAMVSATGSNWSRPVPQRQFAAAKPGGLPNAPAAPSCCSVPNNRGPAPQGQYSASKPIGFATAAGGPSCCAVPNNQGSSRGIAPVPQALFRGCGGCGGCGGAGGQASYQGFQPASGPVQFTSNPPSTGQQVYPAGQASCCPTTGPSNNRAAWNASQATVFPGLW